FVLSSCSLFCFSSRRRHTIFSRDWSSDVCSSDLAPYIHHFQKDTSGIELPLRFTFPFCYDPHELSILAAEHVQAYLESQKDFNRSEERRVGKMGRWWCVWSYYCMSTLSTNLLLPL